MSRAAEAPVAVVTGGARRLGRQLCATLAARGFELVILYRPAETAARALAQEIVDGGGHARTMQVDVSVRAQVGGVF